MLVKIVVSISILLLWPLLFSQKMMIDENQFSNQLHRLHAQDTTNWGKLKFQLDEAEQTILTQHLDYFYFNSNEKIRDSTPKPLDDSVLTIYYLNQMHSSRHLSEDSLGFEMGIKALGASKKTKSKSLTNYVSIRLCEYLLEFQQRTPDVTKTYLRELMDSAKDGYDNYWYKYYYNLFKLQEYLKTTPDKLSEVIENLKNLESRVPEENFHKATYYQYMGIAFGCIYENSNAIKSFEKAIKWFRRCESPMAKIGLIKCDYNIAVEQINLAQFEIGIATLKNLNLNPIISSEPYLQRSTLDWLYKAYDSLEKKDSSFHYLKRRVEMDKQINEIEKALKIKKIDNEYRLEETNHKLDQQQEKNTTLNKKLRVSLLIGLILIIMTAIFGTLYKKYFKQTENLLAEKGETLEKLDELKELVIKNHIILSDKTKVYIANLVYIKSEDHYLKIILEGKKSHLVRGSLSKILEDLPPNFIQCHRSYVVNSNFVKQVTGKTLFLLNGDTVPISRSYQKRF